MRGYLPAVVVSNSQCVRSQLRGYFSTAADFVESPARGHALGFFIFGYHGESKDRSGFFLRLFRPFASLTGSLVPSLIDAGISVKNEQTKL